MPGLRPGRIVDFVDAHGKHVPAMVTDVVTADTGTVALTIFEPFATPRPLPFIVNYDENHSILTWHWLEQA